MAETTIPTAEELARLANDVADVRASFVELRQYPETHVEVHPAYAAQIKTIFRIVNRCNPIIVRLPAILSAVSSLIEERSSLRSALVGVINRGTDGGCAPEVSTDFLCMAPDEVESVKRQRDEARDRIRQLEEANAALRAANARLEDVLPAALSFADPDRGWYADYRAEVEAAKAGGAA